MFRFEVRVGGTGAIGSCVVTSLSCAVDAPICWCTMHDALYQPDPVPAHALGCSIYLRSSTFIPCHCYWIAFACTTCHVAGSSVVALWSRCVGAVWAQSGIAESIIGGKMANVPEDEKWRTQILIQSQIVTGTVDSLMNKLVKFCKDTLWINALWKNTLLGTTLWEFWILGFFFWIFEHECLLHIHFRAFKPSYKFSNI